MVTSTISNSTASTGNNGMHPDIYNGMVLIQAFKKAKSSLQASFSAPHIKIFIIQPNVLFSEGQIITLLVWLGLKIVGCKCVFKVE